MTKAIRQRKLIAMGEHPDTGGRESRTTPIPGYKRGGKITDTDTPMRAAVPPVMGPKTPRTANNFGGHGGQKARAGGKIRALKRGGLTGFLTSIALMLLLSGCVGISNPIVDNTPKPPEQQISWLEHLWISICDGLGGEWSNGDGGSCTEAPNHV